MKSMHSARCPAIAIAIVAAAALGAACGSSSSKPSAGGSTTSTGAASNSSASGGPSSTAGSSTSGSLTVTGSMALSLHPTAGSHGRCTPPATGSSDGTKAVLDFDDGTTYYALQFDLPPGATTFTGTAPKGFVALFASTDSTKEWSIGTNVTAAEKGNVTFNGKRGTIDVDMAPDPPSPNPALKPIHVSGTFECP
jgi:hypothetical protein